MSTIAVNNLVFFILKNFNIDYLKNNVLLVRPLWLSALHVEGFLALCWPTKTDRRHKLSSYIKGVIEICKKFY